MNSLTFKGYPVRAAEIATKARRSLGIGYIGLAHYLAKNGVKYDQPESWQLVHDLTEAFQYYLIQATVNVAKEKGACEYSGRTKYGNGILPIDTYKKDVDEICTGMSFTMIGRVLGTGSGVRSTELNIVRTNAFGEQFRCVKCHKRNRTT